MRINIIILLGLCWTGSSFSQQDAGSKFKKAVDTLEKHAFAEKPKAATTSHVPLDSAEAAFRKDSLLIITPKLVRTELRLDSRASTFQGTEVNIYGYYFGVMIKSKLSLGLGYYRISTVLPAKNVVNGVNINTSLVVNCGSLNTELIYYNRRYISLGFPLEFAFGQYNLTNASSDEGKIINQQVKFLAFANFGLSGTFKPFQFIGLKLMAGYRKCIYPEEKVFNFNGVYTSLGLYIDFADFMSNIKMYKLLKRNHKVKNALSTNVDLFTD